MSGHRLAFVGGLHRSGTSPLARALGSHPQISVLRGTGVVEDEGQHLQDVYPTAKTYGGAGRFARSPRAHLTEASPLVTPDAARRLRAAWDPYWDLDRPVLLEKSPPNLVMGRFLQALFPGSALVVVVRHPVVVALSTKKWRGALSADPRRYESLPSLVEHWLAAHRVLEADLPALRSVHVVRYEHLVRDPGGELSAVLDLLGLDGPVPQGLLEGGRSLRYEQRWDALASPLHPWHRQRRRIERDLAEPVRRFGYDVADLQAVPSLPSGVLAR